MIYDVLKEIQEAYSKGFKRTIFNFYIFNKAKDSSLDVFSNVLGSYLETNNDWESFLSFANTKDKSFFENEIDMITKCVNNDNHIFKNPNTIEEPEIQFDFDDDKVVMNKDFETDNLTFKILQRGKNLNKLLYWLVSGKTTINSYLKTINKKKKNNYGELAKKILNKHLNIFTGSTGNDLQINTIESVKGNPWIKKLSSSLIVHINNDKIICGGRAGLTQSIDLTLTNKSCLILFKNGTMHVLNSKVDEVTFDDFIINILKILNFVVLLILNIFTQNNITNKLYHELITSKSLLDINIESKNPDLEIFKTPKFPFNALSLGILNLSCKTEINLNNINKIKNDKIKIYPNARVNLISLSTATEIKTILKEFEEVISTTNVSFNYNELNPFLDDISFLE